MHQLVEFEMMEHEIYLHTPDESEVSHDGEVIVETPSAGETVRENHACNLDPWGRTVRKNRNLVNHAKVRIAAAAIAATIGGYALHQDSHVEGAGVTPNGTVIKGEKTPTPYTKDTISSPSVIAASTPNGTVIAKSQHPMSTLTQHDVQSTFTAGRLVDNSDSMEEPVLNDETKQALLGEILGGVGGTVGIVTGDALARRNKKLGEKVWVGMRSLSRAFRSENSDKGNKTIFETLRDAAIIHGQSRDGVLLSNNPSGHIQNEGETSTESVHIEADRVSGKLMDMQELLSRKEADDEPAYREVRNEQTATSRELWLTRDELRKLGTDVQNAQALHLSSSWQKVVRSNYTAELAYYLMRKTGRARSTPLDSDAAMLAGYFAKDCNSSFENKEAYIHRLDEENGVPSSREVQGYEVRITDDAYFIDQVLTGKTEEAKNIVMARYIHAKHDAEHYARLAHLSDPGIKERLVKAKEEAYSLADAVSMSEPSKGEEMIVEVGSIQPR